jgi:acetyl-CoA/propionyl-CoA carboxylase biotin carboxyl carrier protein
VEDQLRIAAGEPLGFGQADVTAAGHAVEVRLYAEDAEAGFLPATGRIEELRWPSGPGIRVDAGVARGDEVTGRFDPMLAKVIAHGATRNEALDRLTATLDETVVLGLTTNLRFLRWLVRQPVVRDGEARIDTLERIWPPDDWNDWTATPDWAWSAAAEALAGQEREEPKDPWRGGWRVNGPPVVHIETDGVRRTVIPRYSLDFEPSVAKVGDVVHVDVFGRSIPFRITPPPDVDRAARAATSHTGGPVDLVAPMPGVVLAVEVALGEAVASGEAVVTLEAMKMEHGVVAPIAGRLAELRIAAGDQVTRGQVLGVVEP